MRPFLISLTKLNINLLTALLSFKYSIAVWYREWFNFFGPQTFVMTSLTKCLSLFESTSYYISSSKNSSKNKDWYPWRILKFGVKKFDTLKYKWINLDCCLLELKYKITVRISFYN